MSCQAICRQDRLDRPACIHSQIVYLYDWQIETAAKCKETICNVLECTAFFHMAAIKVFVLKLGAV